MILPICQTQTLPHLRGMQYIPTMLLFENSLQILLETACILAPALTSFAVTEGRCCTAELFTLDLIFKIWEKFKPSPHNLFSLQ
jgi:hypothetical protein